MSTDVLSPPRPLPCQHIGYVHYTLGYWQMGDLVVSFDSFKCMVVDQCALETQAYECYISCTKVLCKVIMMHNYRYGITFIFMQEFTIERTDSLGRLVRVTIL